MPDPAEPCYKPLASSSTGASGPKAQEFFTSFCAHRATVLKADGKEIISVKLVLRTEAHPEEG
jgi:hypothetical protein